MNQKIELHIGELILRDVPYALRHHVSAALERELIRLLSEQELPPALAQGGHIPQIDIGTMQLAPDTKPDAIGAHIAQNIYRSLTDKQ
jgi:hypothetical protein